MQIMDVIQVLAPLLAVLSGAAFLWSVRDQIQARSARRWRFIVWSMSIAVVGIFVCTVAILLSMAGVLPP